MNKQKSSLDIAKFICAILILVIHTNPFGSYSNLLSFGFRNIICVIAVPFSSVPVGICFQKNWRVSKMALNEMAI